MQPPPYCNIIIGINKHFPTNYRLNKIFNRNNVKVSYSCLPNIASIISSHNKSVLSPKDVTQDRSCNWKQKELCPLEGKCLQKNTIYRCHLKSDHSDHGTNYISQD